MFTKSDSDLLSEKLTEFKRLVLAYAKQEIQHPLSALLKWTLLGLFGSVFIFIGILYISLGLLRLLQDKIQVFDEKLSFAPYCITALCLLALAVVLFQNIRKHN